MFLVVIPWCSDHNDSPCTASCNVRTFTDEDPTAGESAQLSVVSAAVNSHHTNVKPTVRHLRKLPFYHCCIPLLCTRLGAIHTATQVHTSARHWRIPVSCLTSCELLLAQRGFAGVAGRRNTLVRFRSSLWMPAQRRCGTQYTSSLSMASSDCSHPFCPTSSGSINRPQIDTETSWKFRYRTPPPPPCTKPQNIPRPR